MLKVFDTRACKFLLFRKNVSSNYIMSFIKYEQLNIRKQRVSISSHDSTHGVSQYVKSLKALQYTFFI